MLYRFSGPRCDLRRAFVGLCLLLGGALVIGSCSDDCPPNGDKNSFFCQSSKGSQGNDGGVDGGTGQKGDACVAGAKPGDLCSASLKCSPTLYCTCGDGIVDSGEQCDGGKDCDASCRRTCNTDSDCGDSLPCRTGAACDQASKTCQGGTLLPSGSTCGQAGTCDDQGNCLSCNLAGGPCALSNRCEQGVVVCVSGQGRCASKGPIASGAVCGDKRICNGQGACVGCERAGQACEPSNYCLTGTLQCDSAQTPRCVEGAPDATGKQCAGNGFCAGGQCVNCANAGKSCTPPDGCHSGKVVCAGNKATCEQVSDLANGTVCRVGSATGTCQNGACTGCSSPGVACPLPECFQTAPCEGGAANCLGYAPAPVGTSCDGGKGSCDGDGVCVACNRAGQSCVPSNECLTGTVSACATPSTAPVCTPGAAAPSGTACGNNGRCDGSGVCVQCDANQGGVCRPGSDCVTGSIGCDRSTPVCITAGSKPTGTQCGQGGKCDRGGICIECSASGNICRPPQQCYDDGVIQCVGGNTPECKPIDPSSLGAICSENGGIFCDGAGNCTTCSGANASCVVPDKVCRKGKVSCQGTKPVCAESGLADPGTSCGTGLSCDSSGQCVACTASLVRENTGAACGDGVDNDCDGLIDGNDSDCRNLRDRDGDGWCPLGRDLNADGDCFDPGEAFSLDDVIAGRQRGDCDDDDSRRNPGKTELCNDGLDNDCNGLIDATDPVCADSFADRDRDGWCALGRDLNADGDCRDAGEAFNPSDLSAGRVRGDCDDNNLWRNPGLREICDGGPDNDCRSDTLEGGTFGACGAASSSNCYLRFRNDVSPPSAYLMCITHVSWWSARDTCGRAGMSLARIDNHDENEWVWHTYHDIISGESLRGYGADDASAYLGRRGYTNDRRWEKGSYWLGLYDANPWAANRGWVTEPGWYLPSIPAPYFNWRAGDPNNPSGSRCVRTVHELSESGNEQWTDRNCDNERFKFICERF